MSEIIPGYYIVRLQPGTDPRAFMRQAAPGNVPDRVYSRVLNGCSVYLDDAVAAALRNNPRVVSVNPVATVDADYSAVVEEFPGWALERVTRSEAADIPLTDKHYERTYSKDGAGTVVYLNDTGDIRNHVDFQHSNVMKGYMADGIIPSTHGTPVASCVMGKICGVAKAVSIVETVISNAANVIECLDWIVTNHPGGPGIINVSWSMSPIDLDVDAAMQSTINAGFIIVTSAGNNNEDASLRTPASVPDIVTVGGITYGNEKYSSSSWGPAVDIWAPAVDVRAASALDSTAYIEVRGTSFAAPLTAGTLALVWAENPTWTTVQVIDHVVLTLSLKDAITFSDATQNNNNRLLYIGPQTAGAIHSAYVGDYIDVVAITELVYSSSAQAVGQVTVPAVPTLSASASASAVPTAHGYSKPALSASAGVSVSVSVVVRQEVSVAGSSQVVARGQNISFGAPFIASSSSVSITFGPSSKMQSISSVSVQASTKVVAKVSMSATGTQAAVKGNAVIVFSPKMFTDSSLSARAKVERYAAVQMTSTSRMNPSDRATVTIKSDSNMTAEGRGIKVTIVIDSTIPSVVGEKIDSIAAKWQLKRTNGKREFVSTK